MLGSWWEVVTNRRFVAFALFCSAELARFNQLYLTLPLEAERVTGSAAAVSAVFLVYTVAAIAGQVRITAWCRARWSAGTSVAVGLAVQGAGFLPLMISSPLLATDVGAGSVWAAALAAIPVLIGTLVFAVGMMIAFPFVMALLPVVDSERLTGTYYGVFYMVSAITAGAVSWLAGGLVDLTDSAWRWSPGAALLAVGLAAATGIAIMRRRAHSTRPGSVSQLEAQNVDTAAPVVGTARCAESPRRSHS
ncbi:MAG: hypothetical protein ACRDRK_07430 [Pseudonocardia sp.]